MSLLHLLFGFSGRINRGKYWLAVVLWLVFWAIALPACLLAGFYILGTNLVDGELPSGSDWLEKFVHMTLDYVVLFIIFLTLVSASWISAFAIGIKRLHDRNKNGWLIVLFYVAPSILAGIANTSEQAVVSFVLGLASFGISIWGLVELGFLRGTVGPNPYGPDPLQAPAAAHPLRPHPPVPEHLQEDVRSPSAAATSATIRTLVTRFSVGRLQCVLFLR
jgi:uncharacterized membrane protein YhaH (DUF805 family)